MNIDTKLIKELAKEIEKYSLEEITLESEGTKVTLKREVATAATVVPQAQVVPMSAPKSVSPKAMEKQEAVLEDSYEAVTSPMIGTFYRSPAPGAEVFVKEGVEVNAGDTLCIVEAMKLMNEVKADKSGKIVKILVDDGKPVKKGQKLFLIDTK